MIPNKPGGILLVASLMNGSVNGRPCNGVGVIEDQEFNTPSVESTAKCIGGSKANMPVASIIGEQIGTRRESV
jgi:hypothetical protein